MTAPAHPLGAIVSAFVQWMETDLDANDHGTAARFSRRPDLRGARSRSTRTVTQFLSIDSTQGRAASALPAPLPEHAGPVRESIDLDLEGEAEEAGGAPV